MKMMKIALAATIACIGTGIASCDFRSTSPTTQPVNSPSPPANLPLVLNRYTYPTGYEIDPPPVHSGGQSSDAPELVRMGNTLVTIPIPDGFTRIGPEAKQILDFVDAFTGPQNRLCAYYLPSDEAGKRTPSYTRQAGVQILRSNEPVLISSDFFAQFKLSFRLQQQQVFESVQKTFPGLINDANRSIKAQGIDFKALQKSAVSFPVHEETENAAAFSLYVEDSFESGGVQGSFISARTVAFITVRRKMFMLNFAGGPDDLLWTRSSISQWIKTITDANKP